jgi:hypothetical protein
MKSKMLPIALCMGIGIVTVWADCTYYQSNGNPLAPSCGGAVCNGPNPAPIECTSMSGLGSQQPGTTYTNKLEVTTTTGATCTYPQAGMQECAGGTKVTLENVKQTEHPCEDCGG